MLPAITAEWTCTRCGSTNRKLLAEGTTSTTDRCVSCGPKSLHTLTPGERPVRWDAKLV